MVDDNALLKMIMEKHPDQGPDFIIEQFTVYKQKLSALGAGTVCPCEGEQQDAPTETVEQPVAVVKRRYSKRSLKVKPEEAIQEEQVLCCLCGASFKSLTALHLRKAHGISVEDYKRLCGYDADTSLMSNLNLRKVREAVTKAQTVRKEKAAQAAA